MHLSIVYARINQIPEIIDTINSCFWLTFDIGKFTYVLYMQHVAASKVIITLYTIFILLKYLKSFYFFLYY